MKLYGVHVDQTSMTMIVEEVEIDGEEELADVEVPIVFEVCGRCRGKGSHTNPSIDGNGITSSEWEDWHEDERETYLSGGYDVPCYECGGARVVPEIDEEACKGNPRLEAALADVWERERSEREYQAEIAAERRYCGEW